MKKKLHGRSGGAVPGKNERAVGDVDYRSRVIQKHRCVVRGMGTDPGRARLGR